MSIKSDTENWFDPEEYEDWLGKGKSQRAFARLKNKPNSTIRDRYKAFKEKQKIERQLKRSPKAKKKAIENTDTNTDSDKIYKEVPRVYGRLPPTNYKSNLEPEEWMRKFCAPIFHWPQLEYVSEIIREMVYAINNKILRLLLEPRNHGKTHTMTSLYLWWLLEEKQSLLVITSDASQKARVFNGIMMILESDIVRSYYGDVIKNKQSNMGEIWFHNDQRKGLDPTFRVAGKDATFIGAHPDWIDLHDPVQEEAVSEVTNERFKSDFNSTIKPMTKRITCNGTRKGIDDYYEFLIDQGFKPIHRKAIVKLTGRWPNLEDCIIETYDYGGKKRKRIIAVKPTGTFRTLSCPNFTTEDLLIERILNLESFESQYQNEPISYSGVYFKAENWRTIAEYEMTKGSFYLMGIDPSYAENRQAKGDNTAMVVCAVTQGRLIQVDGLIDKISWDEIAQRALEFKQQYNLRFVLLGSDKSSQKVQEALVKAGVYNALCVPEVRNKIVRISSMDGPFENGIILILKHNPIEKDLEFEYLQYNEKPSTYSRKDDGLDALEKVYARAEPFLTRYVRRKHGLKIGSWSSNELKL